MKFKEICRIASRTSVARRAFLISLFVGNLVGLLNHGDKIFTGHMTSTDWLKYGMTFLIPYSVSTASSVLAIRDQNALLDKLGQTDIRKSNWSANG